MRATIVLLVVCLIGLAACGDDEAGPTPPAAPSSERSVVGGPELADGAFAFSVNEIEVVASLPTRGGGVLAPADGQQLVAARVNVRNEGDAVARPLCGAGAVLVDSDDRIHLTDKGQEEIVGSTICEDLEPGRSATETLAFLVPEGISPAAISLYDAEEPGAQNGDADRALFVIE